MTAESTMRNATQAVPLGRRVTAEAVGTAFLLAAVVGSGIAGERLAGGNTAIALLANSLATGTALVALILVFGPISGGHFNPLVTLAEAWERGTWRDVPGYLAGQVAGAFGGVAAAHVMFGELPFEPSHRARSGPSQAFSELVATLGLLMVVRACSRRPSAAPWAVGAYITSAYWFTASTSFANPAVTVARALTPTFSGIQPRSVPVFLVAQLFGAAVGTLLIRWLAPPKDGPGGDGWRSTSASRGATGSATIADASAGDAEVSS